MGEPYWTRWPKPSTSTTPTAPTCSPWPGSTAARPSRPVAAAARTRYADWPSVARATVTELRRYGQRQPYDPRLAELVGELSLRDNDFRTWWAEGDAPRAGPIQLHHPLVGELALHHEALATMDDPEQTLVLYPAQTGSVSEDNLALLASWTLHDRSATWAM